MKVTEKEACRAIYRYREKINRASSIIMRDDVPSWEKRLWEKEIEHCKREISSWQSILN